MVLESELSSYDDGGLNYLMPPETLQRFRPRVTPQPRIINDEWRRVIESCNNNDSLDQSITDPSSFGTFYYPDMETQKQIMENNYSDYEAFERGSYVSTPEGNFSSSQDSNNISDGIGFSPHSMGTTIPETSTVNTTVPFESPMPRGHACIHCRRPFNTLLKFL